VSARAGAGRLASAIGAKGVGSYAPEGWVTIVVGSVAPLSLMKGGVFAVIRFYKDMTRAKIGR
jgi:hypothetical protein